MMNDDDNEGDDDEGDEDRPQSQGWLGWWQFWWSDKVQFIIFLCSQLLRHTWCFWGWPRWRSVCCWFLTTASSFIGGATMVVENWSVSKPFTSLVSGGLKQPAVTFVFVLLFYLYWYFFLFVFVWMYRNVLKHFTTLVFVTFNVFVFAFVSELWRDNTNVVAWSNQLVVQTA